MFVKVTYYQRLLITICCYLNKRYRKPNGQSRMGNPETHTRHWTKTNKAKKNTHNTTQKNNKMSNTDHTTKPTAIPRTREGYSVPASYKTPAMLLIYSRRVRHNYRQTTSIKHEPSNKQLCVKTKLTSFSCGNRSGHHNYERRDIQYDKMNNKPMNQSKMAKSEKKLNRNYSAILAILQITSYALGV